jgi:nickel-dependent lactate racemase
VAEAAAGFLLARVEEGRLAVAIPDRTRPAWAREPLRPLLDAAEVRGLPRSRIDLLVARGLHEGPAPADVTGLGPSLHLHDAAGSRLVEVGRLGSSAIRLNALWVEASARLSLGTAGFHYLAGFGGGRKSVVPGLAGAETIRAIHGLALSPEGVRRPGVGPGILEGNPMHARLEEAVSLSPPTLAVEALLTAGGPRWLVGDWRGVHRRGAAWVEASRGLRVPEKRALVVASVGGHPRDRDLIQSHKALEHLRGALRDGGSAVLLARCAEGAGHPDLEEHLRLGSAAEVASALRERFVVYGQTAWALREKAERYHLVLVSELDPGLVASAGLEPAASLAEALDRVRRRVTEGEAGWLLPEAGVHLALPPR